MADSDEREEELTTLSAIYPELVPSSEDFYGATLEIPVSPSQPLLVRFVPSKAAGDISLNKRGKTSIKAAAYIERDVELSHLPPLTLHMSLPEGYPQSKPPQVQLEAQEDWLPSDKLKELEKQAEALWEDFGRCQTLFSYIDYLQQAAESGFDLAFSTDGCLVLPMAVEKALVTYDAETKGALFDAGTYECGICIEPKKGTSCYRLSRCGHVFCKSCLQEFYNSAIKEGDVANVKCLSPDCGKKGTTANGKILRQTTTSRAIHPRELLAMGLEDKMVRRFVEMKRKKKLEADKQTVYCPRTWCQGAAKSPKYPPIPADLATYPDDESDDESTGKDSAPPQPSKQPADAPPIDPEDRIAVCEKCNFAFCRVCYRGWHGQFARCYPRDPNELSAEEKASYDYILSNTSPCPTCSSPTQKTYGCNHMICFNCRTHYCYLCGSWLDGRDPYQHFNQPGRECYQRLFELEEGENGQAPGDGRGFAGARRWEQMAIEVAREADAREAAEAAQAAEDEQAARALEAEERAEADGPENELAEAVAQVQINDNPIPEAAQQRPNAHARRRNPFPAHPRAGGAAAAVRYHERQAGNARGGRRPAVNNDERRQAELQRFLDMAERDEEEGWNSDELDEDEDFRIR
ncbi:uncharacterized protein LTR77_010576 [Saxophila tyrrhenica]|uniref:RBR-type E3 ubiquitin transferase n=1 Tax=Saxophila tyrrhenica TaxID=1690608 RepID=A0AAV9NV39_9PEZI|nr:hypothetical protein LTR77_010576 [Saxophila tyrrhenica]